MNVHHLVTMANDICAFFRSEAGEQDAPKEVANHITRFWDPRMRSQIIDHAKSGGEGLLPISRAAVLMLAPPVPRN
jgi:formate dehydrogenase subunit delta